MYFPAGSYVPCRQKTLFCSYLTTQNVAHSRRSEIQNEWKRNRWTKSWLLSEISLGLIFPPEFLSHIRPLCHSEVYAHHKAPGHISQAEPLASPPWNRHAGFPSLCLLSAPPLALFCHLYLQQPLWQMCQKTQQHLLYSFCFVLPNFFWPASTSQLLLQRSTKGTGSVASRTRVKSQFSHLLDVYAWANSWTSLSRSFLVYKMGVISPTLQDWCEMSREYFC